MLDTLEFVLDKASKMHKSVNHDYSGLPYSFHLRLALKFAVQFSYLIQEPDIELVQAAVVLHDVIEDTRTSYRDLVKLLQSKFRLDHAKIVANMVYAVTNEKGRNRKERASEKYYTEMRNTKYAIFIKMCDRLANVFYGRLFNSSMLSMYKKENPDFIHSLIPGAPYETVDCFGIDYKDMLLYLQDLFDGKPVTI